MIDVHCHLVPAELERWLAEDDIEGIRLGADWILYGDVRLPFPAGLRSPQDCWRRLGADGRAVVMPPPSLMLYASAPAAAVRFAGRLNDALAGIAADHPGATALGWLPLQAPQACVEEVRRLAALPRVGGVVIGTSVAGTPPTDACFDPVWRALGENDLAVFVHPNDDPLPPAAHLPRSSTVIGFPTSTTAAVLDLLFSDSAIWQAGVRLCLAHGGGFLAPALDRLRRLAGGDDAARIEARLGQLWFDGVVFGAGYLDYVRETFGADRVLPGSDWPYGLSLPDDELQRQNQARDALGDCLRWCPRFAAPAAAR